MVAHLPELLVIIVAAATAATAFGMLLASIARNPEAAQGLATFLILSMSAVGGAWFPTSIMPEFIQTISKVTLVYWSIEGFLRCSGLKIPSLKFCPTWEFSLACLRP